MPRRLALLVAACLAVSPAPGRAADAGAADAALWRLFADWREAQRPRVQDGVPDYTPPALERQRGALTALRARLAAIEPTSLSPAARIDRRLVEAEMNGLDFDLRVLRPWSRNPAFYANAIAEQSDTPAHEG